MAEEIFTQEDFERRVAAVWPDAGGDDGLVAEIASRAMRSFEEAGGGSAEFWDGYRNELDKHIGPVAERLLYGE